MTKEEENVLRNFEAQVRMLINRYKDLKGQYSDLKSRLEGVEQELALATEAEKEMAAKYATLKTSRMIEVSGGDSQETRNRINKLIREVDKCIALLNI